MSQSRYSILVDPNPAGTSAPKTGRGEKLDVLNAAATQRRNQLRPDGRGLRIAMNEDFGSSAFPTAAHRGRLEKFKHGPRSFLLGALLLVQ